MKVSPDHFGVESKPFLEDNGRRGRIKAFGNCFLREFYLSSLISGSSLKGL